ncbi:MAG TPA: SIS domain-containing protein [Gammaproteobacteria bacterium]|nr:SIS domain-containing protein [Gammaproteobacteria bacterium]
MLNFNAILKEHLEVIKNCESLLPQLEKTAEKIITALKNGGTVYWLGNGGSASDAQHMAAELVGRFKKERRALPSLSLSTDTSLLTALSNDYDFNIIFSRQLEAFCKPNDIVIALSTSGNSENILKGIDMAKSKGAFTIAFTGETGGKLKAKVDTCFLIPSKITARIQEATTLLCHTMCEKIDDVLSS